MDPSYVIIEVIFFMNWNDMVVQNISRKSLILSLLPILSDGVDISQINTYITNLIFLYFHLRFIYSSLK